MQEINLYDLLRHYEKNWLVIVLFALTGLFGGFIYNQYVQVPMYKSQATLLIVNSQQASGNDNTTINNYIELLKSRRVLEPVIKQLNVKYTYEQLVDSVSVSNDKDTEVIKLSISTKDSNVSHQAVDSTVKSFANELKVLYDRENVQVVDGASTTNTPYNVRKSLQLALGLISGFIASVILLFFVFDYRVSKGLQIKNTKILEVKMPSFNNPFKRSGVRAKKVKKDKKKSQRVSAQKRDNNGRFVKKQPVAKKPATKKPVAKKSNKPKAAKRS